MNAVAIERGPGRSEVTRLLARSPLRLLAPRGLGGAAWVFAATFGGGLVDGDLIELEVTVGAGATALVGTQAQTKVYRGASGQRVRATVADGGLLVWLPDPVVPYAGARYTQALDVTLSGGSLILVETLAAGRIGRGERWAAGRVDATIRVRDPELAIEDRLLLDPAHGPLPARLGACEAIATVAALGPRAASIAETLRAASSGAADLRIGASPVPGGVLVRVAGTGAAAVTATVRRLLGGLPELLGDDPFARKW